MVYAGKYCCFDSANDFGEDVSLKKQSFNYDNKMRFHQQVEAMADMIEFALDRRDRPEIARAVLYAITHNLHEMRNVYNSLLNNYELLLEGKKHGEGSLHITGKTEQPD